MRCELVFIRQIFLISVGLLGQIGFAVDEEALLGAIRAHPAEDTPRLVYADWLDEHDRGLQAEFIRAQVEFARLRPGDLKRDELEKKAKTLIPKGAVWMAPPELRELISKRIVEVSWERGFPSEIRLAFEDSNKFKSPYTRSEVIRILNQIPVAASVRLKYDRWQMSPIDLKSLLSKMSLLERVPTVDFEFAGTASDLRTVLSAVPKVRHLVFRGGWAMGRPEIIQELRDSAFAPRLESLTLYMASLSEGALRVLAASKEFAELRSLRIAGTYTRYPIVPLGEEEGLPALNELEISDAVGAEALRTFVRSPRFKALRSLKVHRDDARVVLMELESGQLGELNPIQLTELGLCYGHGVMPISKDDFPKLVAKIEANRAARSHTDCLTFVKMLSER